MNGMENGKSELDTCSQCRFGRNPLANARKPREINTNSSQRTRILTFIIRRRKSSSRNPSPIFSTISIMKSWSTEIEGEENPLILNKKTSRFHPFESPILYHSFYNASFIQHPENPIITHIQQHTDIGSPEFIVWHHVERRGDDEGERTFSRTREDSTWFRIFQYRKFSCFWWNKENNMKKDDSASE